MFTVCEASFVVRGCGYHKHTHRTHATSTPTTPHNQTPIYQSPITNHQPPHHQSAPDDERIAPGGRPGPKAPARGCGYHKHTHQTHTPTPHPHQPHHTIRHPSTSHQSPITSHHTHHQPAPDDERIPPDGRPGPKAPAPRNYKLWNCQRRYTEGCWGVLVMLRLAPGLWSGHTLLSRSC